MIILPPCAFTRNSFPPSFFDWVGLEYTVFLPLQLVTNRLEKLIERPLIAPNTCPVANGITCVGEHHDQ